MQPKANKQIVIGQNILIEDGKPTLIEVTFGSQTLIVDYPTLRRLSVAYENMANIAQFIDAYRLMLITRDEPHAVEHAKDLLKFLGEMANADTQANGQK